MHTPCSFMARRRRLPGLGIQPEDRLNVWRIGRDVRHHHDHIAWLQRGVGSKGGQQLVVQHLHLALRTVAYLKADRAVLPGIDGRPALTGLGQRRQIQNVLLQLQEQRIGRIVVDEHIGTPVDAQHPAFGRLRLVMIGQQPDEIPPLPAPCCQQRLTVIDTGQQRTVRIETGPMGMTPRPG